MQECRTRAATKTPCWKTRPRYLTHCNGKSVSDCLRAYEAMLRGLRVEGSKEVEFQQRESFVSSFMEKWIFYELTIKK